MKLTQAILKRLSLLNSDEWQREDGICCCEPIWNYSQFSIAIAFWWLRFNGMVEARKVNHSIWQSANGIPFYRLKPAGRAALAQGGGE